MWGSKIIGMSVSLAAGSWLLTKYDYTTAILMMAIVIGLIMLVPLFSRERPGEKIVPWSPGVASPHTKHLQLENWKLIFTSLFKVFSLRNSIIFAVVLFISQGGFKYVSTLLPIFTVNELGWTNVEYSNYFAVAKLIGGIAGMLIGGFLIDRFGKKRMLHIYYISALLLMVLFVLGQPLWDNRGLIFTFMLIQNTLYTFVSIGVFAIAMQCCWKKISASQFTLFMTLGNLGQMGFAGLIGPIRANFDWEISLLAFSLFMGISWLILSRFNLDKQLEHVAALDLKSLE